MFCFRYSFDLYLRATLFTNFVLWYYIVVNYAWWLPLFLRNIRAFASPFVLAEVNHKERFKGDNLVRWTWMYPLYSRIFSTRCITSLLLCRDLQFPIIRFLEHVNEMWEGRGNKWTRPSRIFQACKRGHTLTRNMWMRLGFFGDYRNVTYAFPLWIIGIDIKILSGHRKI